jgi:type 1 fimbriae regulatory protein FimB/type 1 fimbriae regulatory protein FimE
LQTEHCGVYRPFAKHAIEHPSLTEKEVDRLIEGARKRGRNGPRDSATILLAYRHGLRAAELCSLYKLANDGHELGASQFAINSAIHSPGSGSVCEVLAGLGRGPSFYVVVHGEHRSAPRVIAAFAGFVHDRQSATDSEHNQDKNA